MSKDTSREKNRKYGLPLIYSGISCIVLSIILIVIMMKKRRLMKRKTYIQAIDDSVDI